MSGFEADRRQWRMKGKRKGAAVKASVPLQGTKKLWAPQGGHAVVRALLSLPKLDVSRVFAFETSFFNWANKQDIIIKNPITTQGIKIKRDDGNIKPASIEDIKKMLDSFDKITINSSRIASFKALLIF